MIFCFLIINIFKQKHIPEDLPSERTCLETLTRRDSSNMLKWLCASVNFERHFRHNTPWGLSLFALHASLRLSDSWKLCASHSSPTKWKKNLIYLSVLWEVCSCGVVLYLIGLLKTVNNLTHIKTRKAGNISPSPSGIDIIKAQGI